MTAITHLAGNQIVIGQYAIQRCLLCGEILIEYNARNMMSPDGGSLPMYAIGGFYEIEGNRTSLIQLSDCPSFESDLDIPENCCIREIWKIKEISQ